MIMGSAVDLERLAREIRGRLVRISHDSRTPHLGSALSCVDLLVAAYWSGWNLDPHAPRDPDRDRVILSKGHAASAWYAVLARRGYFDSARLDTFAQAGSALSEHPGPRVVPGVEAATGSLGHGLPIGVGMAIAAGIQQRDYRVGVILGDGECNEGSVWEAAMTAAANRLDRLVVVIDYNKWQATGRSNEVLHLASLRDKWASFGWSAREVDGHDLRELVNAFNDVPNGSGKPVAIIAHTVKGKGVSFMEDDNNWHYRIPNDQELEAALKELQLA
ncbi:MAG: transketolase [Planctomycetales bacterium]